MRGHSIIGLVDAQLMLASYRNCDEELISDTDIALDYLRGKSLKALKEFLDNCDCNVILKLANIDVCICWESDI